MVVIFWGVVMSKEDIKVVALVIAANAFSLLCFSLLAIEFDKWWISLFSMLVWKSVSYKSKDKEGNK